MTSTCCNWFIQDAFWINCEKFIKILRPLDPKERWYLLKMNQTSPLEYQPLHQLVSHGQQPFCKIFLWLQKIEIFHWNQNHTLSAISADWHMKSDGSPNLKYHNNNKSTNTNPYKIIFFFFRKPLDIVSNWKSGMQW